MEDQKPPEGTIEKIQRGLEEADLKLEKALPIMDEHMPGWEPESDYAGPGFRPIPDAVIEAHEDKPELIVHIPLDEEDPKEEDEQ